MTLHVVYRHPQHLQPRAQGLHETDGAGGGGGGKMEKVEKVRETTLTNEYYLFLTILKKHPPGRWLRLRTAVACRV